MHARTRAPTKSRLFLLLALNEFDVFEFNLILINIFYKEMLIAVAAAAVVCVLDVVGKVRFDLPQCKFCCG